MRAITKEDYPTINQWCEGWGFPEIAIEGAVPPTGFIIDDICCGWVYLTNSLVCYTEFIITNKNFANRELRKEAFKELFDGMTDFAKEQGKSIMMMSAKNPFLIKNLIEIGFVKTDSNMTNLIKHI